MHPFSLEDSLKIVLPYLVPPLVPEGAIGPLKALARRLPLIPRVLLECRLGEGVWPVDLSQCVFGAKHEGALLAAYWPAPAGPGWQRLKDFSQQWFEPATLFQQGIENIWFEFDVKGRARRTPVPNVFLKLQGSERYTTAAAACEVLLGEPLAERTRQGLAACFEAVPEGAEISHIGLMLQRGAETVRVNVAKLSKGQLWPYLARLGWEGGMPPGLEAVFSFVPSPILTFDVGAALGKQIGLECVAGNPFEIDLPWESFLNYLVEAGLCTGAKFEALRGWPGYTEPHASPAGWPAPFILASLGHGPGVIEAIVRKLNHIKITFEAGRILGAKAYLWYGHEQLKLEGGALQAVGVAQ